MITLTMDNQRIDHVVEFYKIFDMVGDIGGFLEGLLLMFAVLVAPIALSSRESLIAETFYKGSVKEMRDPAKPPAPRPDGAKHLGRKSDCDSTVLDPSEMSQHN
eukprot:CAMPEP_0170510278 /NCGR_PEP_ID=MMETSP0208-20121228/65675_1 /TAXON_ID=197538 /ORGANISM="Strombidium inclinatum, Strain S3" /LENGTH=103 /DNA_ID=CAMNT_0010793729 /DNA_START=1082 /DNA_END=1393 /DNA_ORIENTATION=+